MSEFCVVGGDGSSLTAGAKIFSRVEAETAGDTKRSSFTALILRAMSLTGILDDRDSVFVGDLHNCVHIGSLAVEIDGYDRTGLVGDGSFEECWIHCEADRIDVDEDWPCPYR